VSKGHKGGHQPAEQAPGAAVVEPVEPDLAAIAAPMTDDPLVLREWVCGMIASAAEAFKKVHDDGLAEQALAFEAKLAEFKAEISSKLEALGHGLASVEARLARTPHASEVAEIRAGLGRLVGALGRNDIVTPPATVDQLIEALKQNPKVKILGDYKTIGVDLKAGRVLDTQAYNHGALIDGVRCGKLRLSILEG
jgi:hypothetical protein